MIRSASTAFALILVTATAACAQETETAETETAAATEAAPANGGFNLRTPEEASSQSYGGFNLRAPGAEAPTGFAVPDTSISDGAFQDLPDIGTLPAPEETASEDDIIRLDP